MNMKALFSLALLAALAAGTAYADCKAPAAPRKLPSGKTATEEQMVAAHKAVKEFDTATNDYIACLQTEGEAEIAKLMQTEADPKKQEKQKEKISAAVVKKQNAAVDKDKALAARFNDQVKAFKAREGK